ncbi:MAG: formate/nitrite transporter family protein [Actinomycetota bacterium]
MPISIVEAMAEAGNAATLKARHSQNFGRYLTSTALAGAFVGIAVVLLLSVKAPLVAAGSPFSALVGAAVFGIALTLVVFAGADLFTGNNMYMIQGLCTRAVKARELAGVWVASLIGNLVGSVAFAALVHAAGTLAAGATAGKPAPGIALVHKLIEAKNAATGGQLFWRAALCNMLVCLGLWMAMRTKSDGAKLAVLWWALLAFIAAGFEHSVANMTLFSLGIFQGSATVGEMARNLAWTVPGNIVGGVIVGIAYAYLSGARYPNEFNKPPETLSLPRQ